MFMFKNFIVVTDTLPLIPLQLLPTLTWNIFPLLLPFLKQLCKESFVSVFHCTAMAVLMS